MEVKGITVRNLLKLMLTGIKKQIESQGLKAEITLDKLEKNNKELLDSKVYHQEELDLAIKKAREETIKEIDKLKKDFDTRKIQELLDKISQKDVKTIKGNMYAHYRQTYLMERKAMFELFSRDLEKLKKKLAKR